MYKQIHLLFLVAMETLNLTDVTTLAFKTVMPIIQFRTSLYIKQDYFSNQECYA